MGCEFRVCGWENFLFGVSGRGVWVREMGGRRKDDNLESCV